MRVPGRIPSPHQLPHIVPCFSPHFPYTGLRDSTPTWSERERSTSESSEASLGLDAAPERGEVAAWTAEAWTTVTELWVTVTPPLTLTLTLLWVLVTPQHPSLPAIVPRLSAYYVEPWSAPLLCRVLGE